MNHFEYAEQLAAQREMFQARIRELEAALRNVLKPWDGWIFSDDSPIGKARLLLASGDAK